jgi:hypothetical protein
MVDGPGITPCMRTKDSVMRTKSPFYGPECSTYLPDSNSYCSPVGQQLNYGGHTERNRTFSYTAPARSVVRAHRKRTAPVERSGSLRSTLHELAPQRARDITAQGSPYPFLGLIVQRIGTAGEDHDAIEVVVHRHCRSDRQDTRFTALDKAVQQIVRGLIKDAGGRIDGELQNACSFSTTFFVPSGFDSLYPGR